MFVREKRINGYTYLYLVETVREHGRAKQRIVKNLGRKEALAASGALERLASSVARYAERAVVLSQLETGNPERLACKRIGPPLLFGRLWEETGCRAVIEDLLAGRGFEFAVERYAGGRMAIEADLLPWREERLRSAIKTCFKAGLRSITKPENVTSKARRTLRAMLKEKEFPTYRQGRGAPDPKADGFKVREGGKRVYKFRSQVFVRQFPSKAHAIAALTWLDQKGALRKASPARDARGYEWAVTSPRWPERRKFKAVVFVDPFSR